MAVSPCRPASQDDDSDFSFGFSAARRTSSTPRFKANSDLQVGLLPASAGAF